MKPASMCPLMSLVTLALLLGCGTESGELPSDPGPSITAHRSSVQWSPWSEPVHLGPPVNSPSRELGAAFSRDELSLYFGSDRPVGQGAFDIWVSHRACRECPWEEPVNLGPNINSPGGDGGPALSPDGHLLFFSGSRAGGEGGEDIWVSRRANSKDDLSWGPPVNLGAGVNTAANENGPAYFRASGGETANLYFSRGGDIYQARVTRQGEALGPAVPVAELNDPTANDAEPAVRADGREVFFWSTRPGLGLADIWVATRRSVHDPWSTPQNLGPPVNTRFGELTPDVSRDGRTLIFSATATRGSSLGLQDFWMSTRTRLGDNPDSDDDNNEGDGDEATIVIHRSTRGHQRR